MGGEPPRCEFDAERLMLRLDMTVRGEVKAIAPVVEKVMGLVSSMKCGVGKEFEIETAIREALANAIVHGCRENPAHSVQICVGCDEARGVLIVIRDPGPGFDPRQVPSPVAGENLYSSHGRGVYLINELMDEVDFRHGGTEIRMRKR